MTVTDTVMLVSGIVLLMAALGLVIYCVLKSKPYKPLLVLFFVAIVMIGFPNIKKVVFPGGGEIDTLDIAPVANELQKYPNSTTAVANYRQTLVQIDGKYPIADQLPINIRTNLASTARVLQNSRDLSPESRVALSHTELILGQTSAAKSNLTAALKAEPNLRSTLSPTLNSLLESTAQ
jgi:hypothetical protein